MRTVPVPGILRSAERQEVRHVAKVGSGSEPDRQSPVRTLGGGMWGSVGRTAAAKVVAMGVAGVFGLLNTRLVISHFGTDAYAQYGLLASFPTLMPFTDLGVGAVVINAIASSADPARDAVLRRTITTAMRAMVASALVVASAGVVVQLLGLWPALVGAKLLPGGGAAVTWCLLIYAAALPLAIGQRIVVGLGRSAVQVLASAVVSPVLTLMLVLAIAARVEDGNAVPVYSYLSNTLLSIICCLVAWRATGPLLRGAVRDVPRLRSVRGVKVLDTAGPQLVQSLVLPIAFQTDRILLSHLGHSQALAQYNLASSLFGLLTQTVMVAGVAMWPQFARVRAAGRVESPFRPMAVFSGVALGLGAVMGLLAPWAARVLSDGAIALPAMLVAAYAAYVAVEAAKQPLGMYMTDPRGLRFQMLPVLVLVPMNFVISWALIAPMGAAGPIMGSLIAVVICQILPYSWWVRRDLDRRLRPGRDAGRDGDRP